MPRRSIDTEIEDAVGFIGAASARLSRARGGIGGEAVEAVAKSITRQAPAFAKGYGEPGMRLSYKLMRGEKRAMF
jgi:hypothetical protein